MPKSKVMARLKEVEADYAREVVNDMTPKNKETLLMLYVHMGEAIQSIARYPQDIPGLVELAENFVAWVDPRWIRVHDNASTIYVDKNGKTKKLKKSNQKRKIK